METFGGFGMMAGPPIGGFLYSVRLDFYVVLVFLLNVLMSCSLLNLGVHCHAASSEKLYR